MGVMYSEDENGCNQKWTYLCDNCGKVEDEAGLRWKSIMGYDLCSTECFYSAIQGSKMFEWETVRLQKKAELLAHKPINLQELDADALDRLSRGEL